MIKKVLSLILVISMALSMFTCAFAGLSDVSETKYAGAVEALVELGVVNGYTDGTFQPNKIVTRAEMAKMLVITLGQQKAADLAKGTTSFSDVAAEHWAAGYINIAAQSGVIKGYPNGTFNPEATVSYAEAVTMAVRALGYGRVVEAVGTWPTNYMTKAVELGLMDDIGNPSGNDGAIRGNVALLIWNTLTTNMWVVKSENATNGVTYAEGDVMLNVKFPNYKYIEDAIVVDVDVNDGKVSLTLDLEKDPNMTAELVKGNFLSLYGQEVTALYNEKTEKYLSVIPTANNKVVAGKIDSLVGSKIKITDKEYTLPAADHRMSYANNAAYAQLVMDGRDVKYVTFLGMNPSIVVEKTKVITDGVRLYAEYGSNLEINQDALVIKGDKWLTVEDIELGDVVTELIKNELYAVATVKVDGTFTALEEEGSELTMTVDGDEYSVSPSAMYYINDEEEGLFTSKFNAKDMEDEDVVITLNYLGAVVRVDSGDVLSSNGDFYVVTSKGIWNVSDDEGTVEYVKLEGANGEESYAISEDATDIDSITEKGAFVYAEFEDGEVSVLKVLNDASIFGDENEFTIQEIASVYQVKDSYVYENSTTKYKVNSNTVVFTIVRDEDDKFERVDVSEGLTALEDAEAQAVTLVVDSTFGTVKFAYVGEDTTTGLRFGIVTRLFTRNGKTMAELEDAEGDKVEIEYAVANTPVIDEVLAYKIVSDKLVIKNRITLTDDAMLYNSGLVIDVDGSTIVLKTADAIVDDSETPEDETMPATTTIIDLQDKDYEDYKVIVLDASTVATGNENILADYEITDLSEADISTIKLEKEDRVYEDSTNKTIVIFRGIEVGATEVK